MRWPFVSRAAHDRLYDTLVGHVAASRGQYEQSQAEIRRLTDLIVEMKREGFHPPAKPDTLQPVDAGLPDKIETAIQSRATANSDLGRELRKYAASLLAQNVDEDVIAAKVWQGGDYDEDS